MVSNPIQRKWTVAEYLQYELDTDTRYEYVDGEIYAMSGGTDKHSLIKVNTSGELFQRLKGKSCRLYDSDMRVKISDIKYLYPDFSVVCGQPEYADDNHTMLTNPTLIAEVTSPSSEDYDKGTKFDFYQELASLKGYLVIDQSQVSTRLYTQQENGWLLQDFKQRDLLIPLDMIGCELALSDIYLDIIFDGDS